MKLLRDMMEEYVFIAKTDNKSHINIKVAEKKIMMSKIIIFSNKITRKVKLL